MRLFIELNLIPRPRPSSRASEEDWPARQIDSRPPVGSFPERGSAAKLSRYPPRRTTIAMRAAMVSNSDRYSHYTTDHGKGKMPSPGLGGYDGQCSEEPREGKSLTRGSGEGAGQATWPPPAT